MKHITLLQKPKTDMTTEMLLHFKLGLSNYLLLIVQNSTREIQENADRNSCLQMSAPFSSMQSLFTKEMFVKSFCYI